MEQDTQNDGSPATKPSPPQPPFFPVDTPSTDSPGQSPKSTREGTLPTASTGILSNPPIPTGVMDSEIEAQQNEYDQRIKKMAEEMDIDGEGEREVQELEEEEERKALRQAEERKKRREQQQAAAQQSPESTRDTQPQQPDHTAAAVEPATEGSTAMEDIITDHPQKKTPP